MIRCVLSSTTALAMAAPAAAQVYDERPAILRPATDGVSYERRIADIPMRDGVTLHTVILIPKAAKGAPILLTRTPYNAEELTSHAASGNLGAALDGYDNAADVIVAGGYIRVMQDVRGKYGSQGTYVMNRPLAGAGLNPTTVDEATDCYDTIDWLIGHLRESNGKVGTIGISYDGFEALMALVNPHPALRVSVPINPMVDGWRGDDWFHNGAFRQMMIDYIWDQVATRDNSVKFAWSSVDLYDRFLREGSAGAFAGRHELDQIGFWRKLTEHPSYDATWQSQAVDRVLAERPLRVPVMLVHSLWDQEDSYGATAVYRALKPKDVSGDKVYLTLGPWYHGQAIEDGSRTGPIPWDQDAAKWWRMNVLAPFLAHYLKGMPMDMAPVTAFQSGTNLWQKLDAWPKRSMVRNLYLKPELSLGFEPVAGPAQSADYVSDPAHPVPFAPRPVLPIGYDGDHWQAWLTSDQRHAAARPDVLSFTSQVLTEPFAIAGRPVVHLTASTSGSDSDWIVKLIDVYPDEVPIRHDLGGYQLPIAMEIFRGRYRTSLSKPVPLTPGLPLSYAFALSDANHVFLPGHRIMVQVQSSWFPLYDRNPQSYVPNIFNAKPDDYVKATQRVIVAGIAGSFVQLPIGRPGRE